MKEYIITFPYIFNFIFNLCQTDLQKNCYQYFPIRTLSPVCVQVTRPNTLMSHQSQTLLLLEDKCELVAKESRYSTCVFFSIMSISLLTVFIALLYVRNGLLIESYNDEFLRSGTTDLINELQRLWRGFNKFRSICGVLPEM